MGDLLAVPVADAFRVDQSEPLERAHPDILAATLELVRQGKEPTRDSERPSLRTDGLAPPESFSRIPTHELRPKSLLIRPAGAARLSLPGSKPHQTPLRRRRSYGRRGRISSTQSTDRFAPPGRCPSTRHGAVERPGGAGRREHVSRFLSVPGRKSSMLRRIRSAIPKLLED